jgi:hypothetical protein
MIGSSPARGLMKMRATFERNYSVQAAAASDLDGFGQKLQDWREIGTWPCHAWAGPTGGRHTTSKDYGEINTDVPGMIVPLGTDVLFTDRVQKVTDRVGRQLFGAMSIDAIMPRATHLELRLGAVA